MFLTHLSRTRSVEQVNRSPKANPNPGSLAEKKYVIDRSELGLKVWPMQRTNDRIKTDRSKVRERGRSGRKDYHKSSWRLQTSIPGGREKGRDRKRSEG